MKPFKLQPAFKDYLWGGTKLKEKYEKISNMFPLAESWELSAHPDGPSIIASGDLAGTSFLDFAQQHPNEWKKGAKETDLFPVLVKFIDAKGSLSIQVHPDDTYGFAVEHEPGKTEMWVVLEAEPDAFLYYGFAHEISKEEFAERIQNNTLTEVLHKQPVQPGEAYFIPAGTIHAIGAGIVLAEVQQSSNSTYRVYDFARRDAQGNLRPLHVDKALDVTLRAPATGDAPLQEKTNNMPDGVARLVSCPYFTVDKLYLNGTYHGQVDDTFVAFLVLDGNATLHCDGESISAATGDCVFVPTSAPAFTWEGTAEMLVIKP